MRKITLLLCLALSAAMYLLAQTKLGTDQRSPKIPQVVEWGVCQEPTPPPTGSNCTGLELMRFRYEDGTTKVFTLVPATPEIVTHTKFVRVPLN